MVSCHQIAKQKLNALWIFFAKLGGLRSCRAGLVSLKSSPRFRSRLPISDDQASFGGEGGGNEGLPVSRPSLPTGRRAELCLGRAEVPLSSQSSWRRQRRTAAWSGCRWRVSVCVPNRIFVFFSFFFFFSFFVGIFVTVVAAAAASWLSVAWIFVSFVQTLHVPRGGEKGTPTRCPSEHQPISFHCL